MMTIKLETAGLTLNIQVQPSLRNSDIMTDPTMVTSILNNYISNAAKHSKSCISVLATAVEDCLRVEVHDDGPGVPPSFRDHLFRKYQRWEQLKDNVGLGLSSVASQRSVPLPATWRLTFVVPVRFLVVRVATVIASCLVARCSTSKSRCTLIVRCRPEMPAFRKAIAKRLAPQTEPGASPRGLRGLP